MEPGLSDDGTGGIPDTPLERSYLKWVIGHLHTRTDTLIAMRGRSQSRALVALMALVAVTAWGFEFLRSCRPHDGAEVWEQRFLTLSAVGVVITGLLAFCTVRMRLSTMPSAYLYWGKEMLEVPPIKRLRSMASHLADSYAEQQRLAGRVGALAGIAQVVAGTTLVLQVGILAVRAREHGEVPQQTEAQPEAGRGN